MMGLPNGSVPGLYLLAARDIMNALTNFPELYLAISFYEIYGTKLLDLLNEKKEVKCLEDDKKRINICGLTEVAV
jgi:kinesin family protein 2/24